MRNIVKSFFKKMGFTINRVAGDTQNPNLTPFATRVINKVRPYTMTSSERIASLVDAVEYIEKNEIEGDIVECGVWKGGSMLAIIETLKKHSSFNRTLYLYDTFEGMSEPTEFDKDFTGKKADELLVENKKSTENAMWAYAPIELVKSVVMDNGYPNEKIRMVKGKVEDTIPSILPNKIALLRLDTDFYESTKHEMIHLYPLLVNAGVLIIDDYGCWEGARKAVDEYIEENRVRILLNTIDWTGKIAVKA